MLPSAWLCTKVSGVTLTMPCLTSPVIPLKLSTLQSVLQSGCRQGLIPRARLLGRKLSCLLVLIVGCASMTCRMWSVPSVLIVTVMVRQAPLALVGLTLKPTLRIRTVRRQCARPVLCVPTVLFPIPTVILRVPLVLWLMVLLTLALVSSRPMWRLLSALLVAVVQRLLSVCLVRCIVNLGLATWNRPLWSVSLMLRCPLTRCRRVLKGLVRPVRCLPLTGLRVRLCRIMLLSTWLCFW